MRRVSIFFMTALCLLLITGCWNRRELNDLALVVAMSIDKSDDQYMVTLQVVDAGEVSSKIGTSGRTPVITYSEKKEKHVFEAIRKNDDGNSKKNCTSPISKCLSLVRTLRKEGISKSLEFFYQGIMKSAKIFRGHSQRRTSQVYSGKTLHRWRKIPAQKNENLP
ncbi:hypothetical protein ACFSQ7_14640 [Paenibacillus rhizoplanae]